MGKISKDSNIYDKDNNLVRKAPLKNYSIQELEELVDSLPKEAVTERNNAMSMLYQMYNNPKTEEDKEYVKKKQLELLEQLKNSPKTTTKEVEEKLEEVKEELKEPEVLTQEDILVERPEDDTPDSEYVEFEEV